MCHKPFPDLLRCKDRGGAKGGQLVFFEVVSENGQFSKK